MKRQKDGVFIIKKNFEPDKEVVKEAIKYVDDFFSEEKKAEEPCTSCKIERE